MSTATKTIHTARLHNNCPECYGTDGLEITFSQNNRETLFFSKPSPQIQEKLYCNTCQNIIYPVSWTQDIERVYDYNKKIAETNKQYLKVKPLFYIAVVLAIVVVSAVVYFLLP